MDWSRSGPREGTAGSVPAGWGWLSGSLAVALISSFFSRLGLWAEGSLTLGAARLLFSDSAPRHSWIAGHFFRVSDRWWEASRGARQTLAAVISGSVLLSLPARLARAESGFLAGSTALSPIRATAGQPYPVLWILALLLLWPFIPTTLLAAAVVALAGARLLFGLDPRHGGPQFSRSPIGFAWFALGALVVLAMAFSVAPRASALYTVMWGVSFLAAYLVMDAFRRREQLWHLLWAVSLSAIPVCAFGLWQAASRIPTAPGWVDSVYFPQLTTRVFSVFESPIILGQFLAVSIPVTMYLWLRSHGWERLWLWMFMGMNFLTLVLTYTRGSWVAVLISVTLLLSWWRRWALVVLILLVAVAPLILPEIVVERFLTAFDLEYGTNRYRMVIWGSVLEMIRDHPWTGIGPGPVTFDHVYTDYMIPGTRSLHAHNLYLQVALETGILGLMTLMWFGLAVLRLVSRGSSPRPEGGTGDYTVVLAVALTGLMLQGLADFIWYSPKFMMFFWMLVGAVMASALRARWEREAPCASRP